MVVVTGSPSRQRPLPAFGFSISHNVWAWSIDVLEKRERDKIATGQYQGIYARHKFALYMSVHGKCDDLIGRGRVMEIRPWNVARLVFYWSWGTWRELKVIAKPFKTKGDKLTAGVCRLLKCNLLPETRSTIERLTFESARFIKRAFWISIVDDGERISKIYSDLCTYSWSRILMQQHSQHDCRVQPPEYLSKITFVVLFTRSDAPSWWKQIFHSWCTMC